MIGAQAILTLGVTDTPGFTLLPECAQSALNWALSTAPYADCQPAAAASVYVDCMCRSNLPDITNHIATYINGYLGCGSAQSISATSVLREVCEINALKVAEGLTAPASQAATVTEPPSATSTTISRPVPTRTSPSSDPTISPTTSATNKAASTTDPSTSTTWTIVGVVVGIASLAVMVFFGWSQWRRRDQHQNGMAQFGAVRAARRWVCGCGFG